MKALVGKVIALSISDAPDRSKLGFPHREVDRALFSMCTVLIRAGAKILYAGDLRPSGYTFKLFRHLAGAYAGQNDKPFIHVVPQPVVSRVSFEDWLAVLKECRGIASTSISVNGSLLPMRRTENGVLIGATFGARVELTDATSFAGWLATQPTRIAAEAYTAARREITEVVHGRLAIGGKMGLVGDPADQYEGSMPGVAEEAILCLEHGQPFIPLGAFGGVTRDIAIALELLPLSAEVPRGPQAPTYRPALNRLHGLRGILPISLLDELRAVADDDRTERVAYAAAEIIASWIGLSRSSAKPFP